MNVYRLKVSRMIAVLTLLFSLTSWASSNVIKLELTKISGGKTSVTTPFEGTVIIPEKIEIEKGFGIVRGSVAELIFDEKVKCQYFRDKSHYGDLFLKQTTYMLKKDCDRGYKKGDKIDVAHSITLDLKGVKPNFLYVKVVAKIQIVASDENNDGLLVFKEITPSLNDILIYDGNSWVPRSSPGLLPEGTEEGQVLSWYNDTWVPATPDLLQGPVGPMGPQGPQGLPGVNGLAGEVGPQGPQGEKGDKGDIGPQGPQGLPGVDGIIGGIGPQGEKGDKGDIGPQGPQGLPGVDGLVGAIGPQGPQGVKGDKGDIGPQGPQGLPGVDGIAGAIGPQGPQGVQGDKGDKGDVGPQGPQGLPGVDGIAGAIGPQGPQGVQGDKGDKGDVGPQGPQGLQGLQGLQGEKGDKGDAGSTRVVFIKDIKASGTHGGDCTAGSWIVRNLNNLTGDTFAALVGDAFTLEVGVYQIEATAPAFMVNQHQIKLTNITDNVDVFYGTNGMSHSNYGTTSTSTVIGKLNVTKVTTFNIQHRCATTRALIGFGTATSFGGNEVYTIVKITKIQ